MWCPFFGSEKFLKDQTCLYRPSPRCRFLTLRIFLRVQAKHFISIVTQNILTKTKMWESKQKSFRNCLDNAPKTISCLPLFCDIWNTQTNGLFVKVGTRFKRFVWHKWVVPKWNSVHKLLFLVEEPYSPLHSLSFCMFVGELTHIHLHAYNLNILCIVFFPLISKYKFINSSFFSL